MKYDQKLSGILHVILHMAERDQPVTSETLAHIMGTNPVVIRRILSGLRTEGYVRSEKGHGGGWSLAVPLDSITLRDIYAAVGSPALIAFGNRSENPDCLVEQTVNRALDEVVSDAENLILNRLGNVTLAMLSADFTTRLRACGHSPHAPHAPSRPPETDHETD